MESIQFYKMILWLLRGVSTILPRFIGSFCRGTREPSVGEHGCPRKLRLSRAES